MDPDPTVPITASMVNQIWIASLMESAIPAPTLFLILRWLTRERRAGEVRRGMGLGVMEVQEGLIRTEDMVEGTELVARQVREGRLGAEGEESGEERSAMH